MIKLNLQTVIFEVRSLSTTDYGLQIMRYFYSLVLSNREHGMCYKYFFPKQLVRTATFFV